MLKAYMDESGSHDGSQIFALAGFVGTDEEWESFERQWRLALKLAGVKNGFHMADFEAGRGDFAGMSKSQKLELIDSLVTIITRRDLIGFGAAVVVSDFNDFMKDEDRARTLDRDVYCFNLQLCVEQIVSRVDEKVAFIFDRHNEFAGEAMRLYNKLERIHPQWSPKMGPIAFDSKLSFIPLQAADIIAYETFKHLKNRLYDPLRPQRKSLQRIEEKTGLVGGYYDREGLESLYRRILRAKQVAAS